ncbi:MAG: hypothetical protein R3D98_14175 [Candidatus Krumholzibacteriia bacterium]
MIHDPRHSPRRWLPWLLVIGTLLLRPGWLGSLALLSIPVLVQSRGGTRNLLLATWLVALALVFPNWPLLRQAMPVLDPESETNLLVAASELDASPTLITDLRGRLAAAQDPARRARLQLALAHQEARRGRYSASTALFDEVLAGRPDDLSALVGRANSSYFLSRFDRPWPATAPGAGAGPRRIPFNQARSTSASCSCPRPDRPSRTRALGFDLHLAGRRPGERDVLAGGLPRPPARRPPPERPLASGPLPAVVVARGLELLPERPPLPLFVLLAGLLAVAWCWPTGADCRMPSAPATPAAPRSAAAAAAPRRGLALPRLHRDRRALAQRMVLATLLKNRSRTVGLATINRLVWQARLLPGSSYLALGEPGRAGGRLAMLALAVFMITCGWAFDPAATWSSPGLVLASEAVHPCGGRCRRPAGQGGSAGPWRRAGSCWPASTWWA